MGEAEWLWAVATCVKALLIPTYRSTDFEVHRHWLALTSALPLARWYSDASAPCCPLDYPPLFAYFQRILALPATALGGHPSALLRLAPSSPSSAPLPVLIYLRLSVAVTDLVFLLAAARLAHRRLPPARRRLVLVLLLWSPALLIVDHIHFQYNGYLLGILLLSLSFLEEGKDLAGGLAFAVLICSKHLFLVAAPLYFVYLLRHYCRGGSWEASRRFLTMGAAVGAVFAAAFGPFLYYGQMQQVLSRLFPFGRGLCHAYWAPNFWVFYIVLDKVLSFVLLKLGFDIPAPKASFTGGLVGNFSQFAVLPQVTPLITFLLVIFAMSPCLIKAFQKPQPKHITRWVAYAFTCGFMFGWHVHEKASLHFTIPLALISVDNLDDARHYFLLSIVSCYSMFPLLFDLQEYPIKVLLLAIHSILMWIGFSSCFRVGVAPGGTKTNNSSASNGKQGFIGKFGTIYLLGLLGVELWGQLLHPYIFGSRLPFLPLMLISIYCAAGMMYSWDTSVALKMKKHEQRHRINITSYNSDLMKPTPPPPLAVEPLTSTEFDRQHSGASSPPPSVILIHSLFITAGIIAFVIVASFSIHLLLRLLSCRRHSSSTVAALPLPLARSRSTSGSPSPAAAAGSAIPDQENAALIDSLPMFTLASALAFLPKSSPDCAVCLSRFRPHDELRLLPACRHAFHSLCVDPWLRTIASCPLCRASISLPGPPLQLPPPVTGDREPSRSGSFRIEIGSVSRRRTPSAEESGNHPQPPLPPNLRTYSIGSSFEYLVEEEVEAVVARITRPKEKPGEDTAPAAPGEGVAEAAGGGRGWLKEYVDRLASSSFSSLRLSGRWSHRYDDDVERGSWDLEGSARRDAEEGGYYSLYRWLIGA
ncbi:ALG6, ALG8 glycosyltransferase family [Musa troglodytarum]|uniref:dolichyl-P-Glc:Glc1Man9GlcNAc2-PP-dolichol alpha-1,3-glucosyltransferase n=1 Tax=Musa troglodytarum TaxID=320322 RepID=A0A9E7K0W8_9LILI|nr:ALG6, ALG8 glycosyltransferase family [Musa troglodytarum]